MIEKQEIKKNEVVYVRESLTVTGDIASGAKILNRSQMLCELIVKGMVHADVQITWGNGPILFEQGLSGGNITVTSFEGDITAKNVGECTYLTTHRGNMSIGSAKASQLTSHTGNIMIETLSESEIKAHQGNVTVTTLGSKNSLTIHKGGVTIGCLLNSEASGTKVTIYKGDLTIPQGMEKHLELKIFNGSVITNCLVPLIVTRVR